MPRACRRSETTKPRRAPQNPKSWRAHLLRVSRDTFRDVAVAYRTVRRQGELDPPAREAALTAYRRHLPDKDHEQADETVAVIVAQAVREHTDWFWKSV